MLEIEDAGCTARGPDWADSIYTLRKKRRSILRRVATEAILE